MPTRDPQQIVNQLLELKAPNGETLLDYSDHTRQRDFESHVMSHYLANHNLCLQHGKIVPLNKRFLGALLPTAPDNQPKLEASINTMVVLHTLMENMRKPSFAEELKNKSEAHGDAIELVLHALKSLIDLPGTARAVYEHNYRGRTDGPLHPELHKPFLRKAYQLMVELCNSVGHELPEPLRRTPGAVMGVG